MNALVEIKDLTKQFGAFTAVDSLSFGVGSGEVLGFLGPNGAGKSTTMKMIVGFLAPTSGSAKICGHDIMENAIAAKKSIGYLPEGAPAYPDMTPFQFLDFIAAIRGFRYGEKLKRIAETVEKVNLTSVLHQPIDTLSKGFKRRVGLAQSILHDPQVLILDEPTDGLDPNQKYEVRGLIREMSKNKVIILSTHILEEVHAVCTRTIIISNGRLLVDGTPAELEAQSPYHNTVYLNLQQPAANIAEQLQALPQVKRIEKLDPNDNHHAVRIYPQQNQSPISAISRLANEQQWIIEDLHIEKGQLDDVFRTITTATEQSVQ